MILILIPFLPRPPVSGRVDVYLTGLDEHTKNQFRTQIRDNELLEKDYFSQTNASNNPVKEIRMILPAGHKRNYPDSCALMLGFSQENPEPDYLTENQISDILWRTFNGFAENNNRLNRRFLLHFKQDTVINLAAPEFQYQVMISSFPEQELRQFASGILPFLHALRPDQIALCNMKKERETINKSVFLFFALWQLLTGSCFLIRFIITGK